MPYLDPSRILLNPMFADKFNVRRRIQLINGYGEVVTANITIRNVVGVVAMASPTELERLADQQITGKVISIITRYALRASAKMAGKQYQPDTIDWRGDSFVVVDIAPYTHFGHGFVQALAGSNVSQDPAPVIAPAVVGQLDFTDSRQSGYMRAAA